MAQFKVVADKLWHSTQCRMYLKGETIELPDDTKVTKDSSIEPIEATKPAKGKGTPDLA